VEIRRSRTQDERTARTLAALVLLLLAVCLGGCGGSGGKAETSVNGREASSPRESGEASIEDFGTEATSSQRQEVLAVFSTYLRSIATHRYLAACSFLSETVQASLRQIASKALKGKACIAILPKLLSPTAAPIARQQANGEVTKVRVEDDRAFVVFKAPGAKLYQMPMVKQDSRWKVGIATASVLVPEL
jgi:hypothetical protein